MKRIFVAIAVAALLSAACDDTTGPGSQPNPDGKVIAWFNGLANTIDLYYPGSDSLVSTAFVTGNVPNDLLYLGSDMLAVVNSTSSTLQIVDIAVSGSLLQEITFPGGSNPWAMAYGYDNIWVSLLQKDQIVTVSTEDWTLGGAVDVPANPSGMAVAAGTIFVSHANWPDGTSPGGVTALDAITLDELGWIDTGVNTAWLSYFPETGHIHAFSSVSGADGVVSIIDPVTATISAQVQTGGNPQSPVRVGSSFACCDAWGSSIFFYSESGALISTWVPDSSMTSLAGLAVSGDTLYMTDFSGDLVHRALWQSQTLLTPLTAGNGPQGIIDVER